MESGLTISHDLVSNITPHLMKIDSINRSNSSNNAINELVLMLFDVVGCRFLLQAMELTRIIAESTNATSASAAQSVQLTYKLVACITPYLADEKVCAELLQSVSSWL